MDTKIVGLFFLIVLLGFWFVNHIRTNRVIKDFGKMLDEQQLWNSLTDMQKVAVQQICEHAENEQDREETFSSLVKVIAKQNRENQEKPQADGSSENP